MIHLVHTKMFPKTNISYPLIRTRTCAYQEVRHYLLKNFTYVLNEWTLYLYFMTGFEPLSCYPVFPSQVSVLSRYHHIEMLPLVSSILLPLTVCRLTLSVPCISESCIQIKINLNFHFHTSLWRLKRFYKAPQKSFMRHHKKARQ